MPEALLACPCCGLVQNVPELSPGHLAACARCDTAVLQPGRWGRSSSLTFAAALAALVLYPIALILPIMQFERFGHRTEASIWTGSIGLLLKGELFVGAVVLVCSVILPLAKLLSLLVITSREIVLTRRERARTWHFVELTGRFGMLDVLLISVVVAWVKIGDLVEVTPGPAALAFTLVVLLSLLASAAFDPHALWTERSSA